METIENLGEDVWKWMVYCSTTENDFVKSVDYGSA
jgi:hypothetical protein